MRFSFSKHIRRLNTRISLILPHAKSFSHSLLFPAHGIERRPAHPEICEVFPKFSVDADRLDGNLNWYFAKDESLLKEIVPFRDQGGEDESVDPNRFSGSRKLSRCRLERTRKTLSRISDSIFIPDNKIGWQRPAHKESYRTAAQGKVRRHLSQRRLPGTDFLIGKALKEKFHLPLMVDYRDAWYRLPVQILSDSPP